MGLESTAEMQQSDRRVNRAHIALPSEHNYVFMIYVVSSLILTLCTKADSTCLHVQMAIFQEMLRTTLRTFISEFIFQDFLFSQLVYGNTKKPKRDWKSE